MRPLSSLVASIFALAAVACSSNPDASSGRASKVLAPDGNPIFTQTGGTFSALPIDALDGVAYLTPARDTAKGAKNELRVVISSQGQICSATPVRANTTLFMIDALGGDDTFKTGTYTQTMEDKPGQVDVAVSRFDDACGTQGSDYGAESATVHITSVTDTSVAGTFDVTFTNGHGTLQGSFDVPRCDRPLAGACKQ